MGKKDVGDAYILAIALGVFGAHHWYLRRPGFGVLYFFTLGLFGVGYIVDLIRLPYLVQEANRQIENPGTPKVKNVADAYLLWFPGGFFGECCCCSTCVLGVCAAGVDAA